MPCARSVRSDCASQPSSRWANQHMPALDEQVRRPSPPRARATASAPRRAIARVVARRRRGEQRYSRDSPPRGRARVARLELVDQRDGHARRARAARRARRRTSRRRRRSRSPSRASRARPCSPPSSPPPCSPALRAGPADQGRRTGRRRRAADRARVGDIHGNERAGRAVIRAAAPHRRRPRASSVVTVATRQPGRRGGEHAPERRAASTSTATSRTAGAAAGAPFDTYYPGPRAGERAGDAAMMRLIRRYRARRDALVPPAPVARQRSLPRADNDAHPRLRRPRRAARAAAAALPRHRHELAEHDASSDATAFVVELPAGAADRAPQARRHARAALRDGRAARAQRPPPSRAIEQDPIPFPASAASGRCAAYSKRHYGDARAPLTRRPHDRRALHGQRHLLVAPTTRSPPTRPTSSSASCPASARTS